MEMHRPTSVEEALDVLDAHPDALILAGGTDLMVEVTYGGLRPSAVISLRRVDELKEWEGTFVGAGVTWARIEEGPIPALAEAARTVGSPQIRSAGTIGGNLGTASPAGDGLPFLAAVDAQVELASKRGGRRALPWRKFITGPKENALTPSELILGVRLPETLPSRQVFGKIGPRNAMVISIASACVTRGDDDTTKVALGSVGPTPLRATAAEQMISAQSQPDDADLAEFQRLVSEEVKPITDHRSTAEYRRHASGVLARRALVRCLS